MVVGSPLVVESLWVMSHVVVESLWVMSLWAVNRAEDPRCAELGGNLCHRRLPSG